MNKLTKKIWFDENSQPPKDQIWYRGEGKFYEYKNGEWVLVYDIASSCGSSESNNYSTIYNIRTNEITNPKEGDITVVPDSWEEFTVEPTTTEDNGYTIKTYDVTYYGAESRIKVTSKPTMFASSYIDSESSSSHNSGSVSELGSIFHVGTISISLWKPTQENEEFPEVHMYKEVKGETKEYVNGEWVNRGIKGITTDTSDFYTDVFSLDDGIYVHDNEGSNIEERAIGYFIDMVYSSVMVKVNYICYSVLQSAPEKCVVFKDGAIITFTRTTNQVEKSTYTIGES